MRKKTFKEKDPFSVSVPHFNMTYEKTIPMGKAITQKYSNTNV